jgi:hypothetical protein
VQEPASYCVIEPETGEVLASWATANESRRGQIDALLRSLNDFLAQRGEPALGDSIAGAPAQHGVQSSDDESTEKVSMLIEFAEEKIIKRVKIDVAADAPVKVLYKKVESLVGKAGKFKLAFHAVGGLVQLTDLGKSVSEVGCANCLVRVLPE